jgi:hypothetical protein
MKKLILSLLSASCLLAQHNITGAITLNGLTTPATVTITHGGTPGTATYTYVEVACADDGSCSAPSTVTTATGASPLTSVNTNVVPWASISGAYCYWIWRTVAGGTGPSDTTGNVQSCGISPAFTDDGTITGNAGIATPTAATAGIFRLPVGATLLVSGGAQLPTGPNFLVGGGVFQAISTFAFSSTPNFALAFGDPNLTLTGPVTSSTMSGVLAGHKYNIRICENATGGFSFVPPTTWRGLPTFVTTPNTCNYWLMESFDGTNLDFIAGNSH